MHISGSRLLVFFFFFACTALSFASLFPFSVSFPLCALVVALVGVVNVVADVVVVSVLLAAMDVVVIFVVLVWLGSLGISVMMSVVCLYIGIVCSHDLSCWGRGDFF